MKNSFLLVLLSFSLVGSLFSYGQSFSLEELSARKTQLDDARDKYYNCIFKLSDGATQSPLDKYLSDCALNRKQRVSMNIENIISEAIRTDAGVRCYKTFKNEIKPLFYDDSIFEKALAIHVKKTIKKFLKNVLEEINDLYEKSYITSTCFVYDYKNGKQSKMYDISEATHLDLIWMIHFSEFLNDFTFDATDHYERIRYTDHYKHIEYTSLIPELEIVLNLSKKTLKNSCK